MIPIDKILAGLLLSSVIINVALYMEKERCRWQRDRAEHQAETLAIEIDAQNAAIEKMRFDEERQANEFSKQQKEIETTHATDQQDANAILAATIPKNCKEAVKWSVNKGLIIYECWQQADCELQGSPVQIQEFQSLYYHDPLTHKSSL